MQIIKEDEYVKITFDEETKVLGTKWKPTSFEDDLSEEYIREVINLISDSLASTQADYYLADQTDRGVVYDEEMQKWVLQKLMEGGEKAHLKKCAVVQSVDFFVGMSNEQLLKGAVTDIAYKCFSSRREAIEWLGVRDSE